MRTRAVAVLRRPMASVYCFLVAVSYCFLLFVNSESFHHALLKFIVRKHTFDGNTNCFFVAFLLNNMSKLQLLQATWITRVTSIGLFNHFLWRNFQLAGINNSNSVTRKIIASVVSLIL